MDSNDKNKIVNKNGEYFWICKGIERKIRISVQCGEKFVFVHPTNEERKVGIRMKRVKWGELGVAEELLPENKI